MTSFEADRLHASDMVRETSADQMAQVFDLHLRGASPSLANAIAAAVPAGDPTVAVVVAAIIEVAERNKNGSSVAAFDALRQAGRAAPRNDAVMGHALIAALTHVLGSSFDEAGTGRLGERLHPPGRDRHGLTPQQNGFRGLTIPAARCRSLGQAALFLDHRFRRHDGTFEIRDLAQGIVGRHGLGLGRLKKESTLHVHKTFAKRHKFTFHAHNAHRTLRPVKKLV